MKKLRKIALKELEKNALVLENEKIKSFQGGDGSCYGYPYYCPGDAYCYGQAPGTIVPLSTLEREQAQYDSQSDFSSWGGVLTGLAGTATGAGFPFIGGCLGTLSAAIGIYSINQDGNAERLGAAIQALYDSGYNSESNIRIDYTDMSMNGGTPFILRIWDAYSGDLLREVPLY